MITIELTARRRAHQAESQPAATWSGADTVWAAVWMIVGIAARAPLVARIEGALDHDQSIVGLMALDIAAARRWPIFFDGQRYMGAVEAYVAAVLVRLFGHSPVVVAMAPMIFFGLFAAGQYILWRNWSDRQTGHLAALLTIVSSPMLALWSIAPRGGYIEVLAWALPVLGVYRRVVRPGGAPRSRKAEAGWGFLLALGYFLNPLSLIVYVTLALDWTFGRHGADLRRRHHLDGGWIDRGVAPWVWAGTAVAVVVGLGFCCHVEFAVGEGDSPFIFGMGWIRREVAVPLGLLGMAAIFGAAAWWSDAAPRAIRLLASRPYFALGMMAAFSPFLLNGFLVSRGVLPWNPSLPIWIRAPWAIDENVQSGARALGPLVGCNPNAAATLLFGQGVDPPPHAWPTLARGLAQASPLIVAIVFMLIVLLAWSDRRDWKRLWTLRGTGPTPPTILVLLGLGVTTTLYLLQATSLNSSSMRYLVPAWIMLPGLLASALRRLPARGRVVAGAILLAAWGTSQANLWADMHGSSPIGPLVRALEQQGVKGVVAQTPVALIIANLSHGEVGTMEYLPAWPRLRDRYARRIPADGPVICVVDRKFPWPAEGGFRWSPRQDLGRDLRVLAAHHAGRVMQTGLVGDYEIWKVDLPLSILFRVKGAPTPVEQPDVARQPGPSMGS